MCDVFLVERVDGDGVRGGGRCTTGAGCAFGGQRSMAAAILSRLGVMPQQHRHLVKTGINTLPHPGQLPLQHVKPVLLELQEQVV